jgi:hypothetical protein
MFASKTKEDLVRSDILKEQFRGAFLPIIKIPRNDKGMIIRNATKHSLTQTL